MLQAKNIAKTLALLAVILLLGSVRYAYAQQNTGANPYQDSRHSYRVTIGLTANTQRWVIVNSDESVQHELSTSTPAWAHYGPATTNGGYDTIQIFFDHTVFSTGDWYLRFYETDQDNNCVSAREYPINIAANTFYLALSDDNADCNSQDGEPHTYEEVDEVTDVFPTSVTYTVTMTKNDDFDPSLWRFNAVFEQAVASISASVVTSDGGSATVSEISPMNQTAYQVTISTTGSNPSTVEVSVTVEYENAVHSTINNDLTVNNGEAIVSAPPAPDAVTDDNISVYPILSPGDRVQAITIRAIPETHDIVPGSGETASSAQNPLQNSTHRYSVSMGDQANYNTGSTGWHIETSLGVLVNNIAANYELTRSLATGNDLAEITFHMDPGSYVLFYTEENSNGCSTVRPFPFTIGEPFDADIAAAPDDCAAIEGQIFDNLSASNTTIDYTITLNTPGYGSDWSFDFALGSSPVFMNPDLTVSNITTSTAGVTYTSTGTTTGSVDVPSTVSSVVIRVTYNGLYEQLHTITATISNVTGSFDEADADATDSDEHIIYSMPQITALVGVD